MLRVEIFKDDFNPQQHHLTATAIRESAVP
jgi:hypothetical protein